MLAIHPVAGLPPLAVVELGFSSDAEARTEFVGWLDDLDFLHPLISARVAVALAEFVVPVLHQ